MRFFKILLITTLLLLPSLSKPEAKSLSMLYRGFNTLNTPIDINRHQFKSPSGQIENVTDWHGNWVLLNVWATWCAPCLAELPDLAQLAKKNPFPNLKIMAVSFDQRKSQEEILGALERKNLGNFAGYMDINRQFEKHMKPTGLPRTYLVNPQGQVVADYRGAADWLDPRVFQDLSLFVNSGNTSKISATRP